MRRYLNPVMFFVVGSIIATTADAVTITDQVSRIYPQPGSNYVYFTFKNNSPCGPYFAVVLGDSAGIGLASVAILHSAAKAGKPISISYGTCAANSAPTPIDYLFRDF